MALSDVISKALDDIEFYQNDPSSGDRYAHMEDQIEYVKHAMFELFLFFAISDPKRAKEQFKRLPIRKREKESIFPPVDEDALNDAYYNQLAEACLEHLGRLASAEKE